MSKNVKKIPSKPTYIDGYLVEWYHTKATDEDITALNRKVNTDKNCGQKPIYKYSVDGLLLWKYSSVNQAAKLSGTDKSSIRRCADGKYSTANGFIWKWA